MITIQECRSEEEISIADKLAKEPPKADSQKPGNLQSDFDRLISNSRDYLSSIAYKFAEVATNIMSTSKGRNKLCSLIQYQAKLIYVSTINSNIPEVQNMVL